jgi:hypothetical protein
VAGLVALAAAWTQVAGRWGRLEDPTAADLVPRVQRRDFLIQVEMLDVRADASGVRRLEEGQAVAFRLEVERDAFVGIWSVAPDQSITQVFPNEFEPDHRVRAGQPRMVPGGNYTIEATLSGGMERVWVVASTKGWDALQGRREGPFLVFKDAQERRHWVRQTRGLRLKPGPTSDDGAAVAGEVLTYRVSPRTGSGQ